MEPNQRAEIQAILERHWGFRELRPLQEQAIGAALSERDAVVVLPTGGGKSLCYQVPPLMRAKGRLSLVVSPLIALMKDQVDGLWMSGYPAGALHSGMSRQEQNEVKRKVEAGELRLLFISPERLLSDGFFGWLREIHPAGPAGLAVDEAHCISQWGHDFRPEYRRISEIRQQFPEVSIQAFTATASPRVRADIQVQLGLRRAIELVGSVDRPNLHYAIVERSGDGFAQTLELLRSEGHGRGGQTAPANAQGGAILYCPSRKMTEELASELQKKGLRVEAFHAGLGNEEKNRIQEAFSQESLNIVAATIAFGMGIDRSNVRLVIHLASPRSIEAYQQETGRAGRDGMPARCVLLWGRSDAPRAAAITNKSAIQAGLDLRDEPTRSAIDQIWRMHRFAESSECRHRALIAHFGEVEGTGPWPLAGGCRACDRCCAEWQAKEAPEVTQKILSAVVRLQKSLGRAPILAELVAHLRGSGGETEERALSTFGLLRECPEGVLVRQVGELLDEGALLRVGAESLGPGGLAGALLRGERKLSLAAPGRAPEARAQTRRARRNYVFEEGGQAEPENNDQPTDSPEETPIERGALFERLRTWRLGLAKEMGVPPFVIFSDKVLQEIASLRPRNLGALRAVKGVGQHKLEHFGDAVLEQVQAEIGESAVSSNQPTRVSTRTPRAPREPRSNGVRERAITRLAEGGSIEEVMAETGRARTTVEGYFVRGILEGHIRETSAQVSPTELALIGAAAKRCPEGRMRPIYEALQGNLSWFKIRIWLALYRPESLEESE
jgi:ATP-dependent DNA helicase RecQ